jgi:hypothetical protein
VCVKLWVDDRRPAPRGWARAYTVAEAKAILEAGDVDDVSLDHDLGACERCLGGLSVEEWLGSHDYNMPVCEHIGTGYTLCLWMADTGHWPKNPPVVHSMNHHGAEQMRNVIQRYFRPPARS